MAPSNRQRIAAKIVVEHARAGKPTGPALREAGYPECTVNQPSKVTKSKGFREALDELGLTEELLVSSLVEDIQKKPQNRKGEIELGAKMRGMLQERVDLTSGGEQIKGVMVYLPTPNGLEAVPETGDSSPV